MLRNPYTGHAIKRGGPTHMKLMQEGGFNFGGQKLNPADAKAMYREIYGIREKLNECLSDSIASPNLNEKYHKQFIDLHMKYQDGLTKMMKDLGKQY